VRRTFEPWKEHSTSTFAAMGSDTSRQACQ
jgi:hypothetical protein